MNYMAPSTQAQILLHAIRHAKDAQSMVRKVPGTDSIDAELTAAIAEMESQFSDLDEYLTEVERE